MSTNPIPVSLQELLSKLRFLAMIEAHKKPCMTDQSFVDSDSWYGTFKRLWMGESRKTMLLHIQTWIEQGIRALEDYQTNPAHHQLILKDLAAVIPGLEHLITTTYSDDPYIVSQLKTFIDNIQLQTTKKLPIPPIRHPTTSLVWDGKNEKLKESFISGNANPSAV